MFEKLEEQLKRIVELVKLCPANLQEKCFELLLNNLLLNISNGKLAKDDKPKRTLLENPEGAVQKDDGKEEEIKLTDLHIKAKKLLEQGLLISDINNAFYKEGEEIKPLFDDLKSSKISESQIKLALIEAFKNSVKTGDFTFNTDVVKQQCEIYKCYDSANFSSYFKNKSNLFSEEYKRSSVMSLSTDGKKELISTIKALAQ